MPPIKTPPAPGTAGTTEGQETAAGTTEGQAKPAATTPATPPAATVTPPAPPAAAANKPAKAQATVYVYGSLGTYTAPAGLDGKGNFGTSLKYEDRLTLTDKEFSSLPEGLQLQLFTEAAWPAAKERMRKQLKTGSL